MRRTVPTLVLSLALLAVSAPVAPAHDGGEGWWGETDDKVITNAGFILIAFFPTFILVMSVIQWKLEKRKDRRKAAEKAAGPRRRARRLVAPLVCYQRTGAAALVTIDAGAPQRGRRAHAAALLEAFERFAADDKARVMVLTGAGEAPSAPAPT